jgi:hypothetical protein
VAHASSQPPSNWALCRYKAEAAAGAEVGALASRSNNYVVVLDHYCRESWMSLLRV